MFVRRGVLTKFGKFTGKHLCQCLFIDKVAGQPATLLKKRDSGTGVFLWIFRNFYERLLYRTPLGDCFWNALIRKEANENAEQSYFSKKVIVWCFNISMINFKCFHTQREVFFQIKFHPGMKFYSFHPEMKLTCRQKFFHPGTTSFIPGWDFFSVTCKCTLWWNVSYCLHVFAEMKFHPGMKKRKKDV